MILVRLFRALGAERAVDGLHPAGLRAWLVALRTTLAPVSVAGYVRTLRVLGNWLAAEGLANATWPWPTSTSSPATRRPRRSIGWRGPKGGRTGLLDPVSESRRDPNRVNGVTTTSQLDASCPID